MPGLGSGTRHVEVPARSVHSRSPQQGLAVLLHQPRISVTHAAEGAAVGSCVGDSVVGVSVGDSVVGATVGDTVGPGVDGCTVGLEIDGAVDGALVGAGISSHHLRWPGRYTPCASTAVGHQYRRSPASVQRVYSAPLMVNGNTQPRSNSSSVSAHGVSQYR